jgi:coproporphyrinogen III oxidase-like Fe-S oxidoreductase
MTEPSLAEDSVESMMSRGLAAAWLAWRPRFFTFTEILDGWERTLSRRRAPGFPDVVHAYVHFPYCETSCRFCMYFHRLPRDGARVSASAARLVSTISRYRERLGRLLVTNAYFGGGTPSLLDARDLEEVFRAFGSAFEVRNQFTFEANPLSLDDDKIRIAADHGASRMSMGVQSFDPDVLREIARVNGPAARTADLVGTARRAGLEVNVDIVLGLPGQDPSGFGNEVRGAIELGADTVTVYRYQPVRRLDVAPSFRFRDAFRARDQLETALRGYAPFVPSADDAYGAKLVRWGRLGRWVSRSASRLAAGGSYPEYACFEAGFAHVLGIGTGAWSHTFGASWHRDVSPLDGGAADPVFHGSALSRDDELRTELLRALDVGTWVDVADLQARTDPESPEPVSRAVARGVASGALVRRFGRVRPAQRGDAFRELVRELLPARMPAVSPEPGLRFQKELVDESTRHEGQANAWREMLGVPVAGGRWLGADVVAASEAEVHFRVGGQILRLQVVRAGSGPSYAASARFAIRYLDRKSLAPVEAAFLSRVAAEMATRDPAGDAAPR